MSALLGDNAANPIHSPNMVNSTAEYAVIIVDAIMVRRWARPTVSPSFGGVHMALSIVAYTDR